MSRINLASMNQHLAEISRSVKPGADALLIIDGAGWHGDAGLVVRASMTGRYLPVPPGTQSARNKKVGFLRWTEFLEGTGRFFRPAPFVGRRWICRRYGPSLNAQPQGPSAGTALARRLE